MKGKKGITLIALIITIIVMLILVGVTINVALNGGLFEKAKNAKEQTQIQTEKEELISIAVAAWDANKSEVDSTKLNLGNNFESTTITKTGKIVVKAKDTNNLWQIDVASAKVEEYKETQGKTYSFTINGLEEEGIEETKGDSSVIIYDFNSFKSKFADDIFTDEGYYTSYEEKGKTYFEFGLSSNNNKFGNALKVFFEGEDPEEGDEYFAFVEYVQGENDIFLVIVSSSGEPLDSSEAEEFFSTYGDTVFTFVKKSG